MMVSKGQLVLIGGGEDKEGDCVLLREVVKAAGGKDGLLALMAVASKNPETVAGEYAELFRELGMGGVDIIQVNSREEASSKTWLRTLREATAVFISGGDQLRLTAILGGTPLGDYLHERYREGMLVSGSSAGASAMTETMIVGGAGDDSPEWSNVRMAPGLGLLRGAVVDQHFAQRGRIGRLLGAVAQNPQVLGLGLDEDTALIVGRSLKATVLGSRTVSILDGHSVTHSNASEVDTPGPLALLNVALHVLPSHYAFDLSRRRPLRPKDLNESGGENNSNGDKEPADI